jgi:hypothetical protein
VSSRDWIRATATLLWFFTAALSAALLFAVVRLLASGDGGAAAGSSQYVIAIVLPVLALSFGLILGHALTLRSFARSLDDSARKSRAKVTAGDVMIPTRYVAVRLPREAEAVPLRILLGDPQSGAVDRFVVVNDAGYLQAVVSRATALSALAEDPDLNLEGFVKAGASLPVIIVPPSTPLGDIADRMTREGSRDAIVAYTSEPMLGWLPDAELARQILAHPAD